MEENYYPLDPNASVEVSRLLRQDHLITEHVSGLFPENIHPASVESVLDIGCGPGGWISEVARRFPTLQLTGLDISEQMIAHAQRIAQVEQLNLRLLQGSFVHLPFPDASFDFANARLVQWFVDQQDRTTLAQEWYRVVRPGGWLRFIEAELPITNGPAGELLASLFLHMLHKMGKGGVSMAQDQQFQRVLQQLPDELMFQSQPRNHGMTLLLRQLLEQLGCEEIHVSARVLEYSANAPAHEAFVQDLLLGQMSYRDALVKNIPGLTAPVLDALNTLSAQEMHSPNFLGALFFVCVWGRKPFDTRLQSQ